MSILTFLGLTPYATTSDVIIAIIEIVLGFVLIFYILIKVFREPTDKEWSLTKLSRRISAYSLKMENLERIKKLIENKDFDSINNILIKYVPANKKEFIEFKNKCKTLDTNKEEIYLLLENWLENEEQVVKHILDQLVLESKQLKTVKKTTKKSFYE